MKILFAVENCLLNLHLSNTATENKILLIFPSLSRDHRLIYHNRQPWTPGKDHSIIKTLVFAFHHSYSNIMKLLAIYLL